jgi:hypothetical protein
MAAAVSLFQNKRPGEGKGRPAQGSRSPKKVLDGTYPKPVIVPDFQTERPNTESGQVPRRFTYLNLEPHIHLSKSVLQFE